MRTAIVVAGIALHIAALHSGAAMAAPAVTSTDSVASQPATRTYDLDFTLPTYGKSGCLVCHGDPNLVRLDIETTSSAYVDVDELNGSAHTSDTPCTGCHVDFAFTSPHKETALVENWLVTAKSECKNCHTEQFSDYANGAHSPAGKPGLTEAQAAAARVAQGKPRRVPLCGDCHGGHSIPATDNVAARSAFQVSGREMCGQEDCHSGETGTYDDYYHGAAYRLGSTDAPACWDCHGYHDIIPASTRTSSVHPSRLVLTCGQEGCHAGVNAKGPFKVDEKGFLDYAQLVHGQQAIVDENPLSRALSGLGESIQETLARVLSWFQ